MLCFLWLSQALLIASFWLFYNQCDLAIIMIKVILVKSLILKSIDLQPVSLANFGLISSIIRVIFKSRNTNILTLTEQLLQVLRVSDSDVERASRCEIFALDNGKCSRFFPPTSLPTTFPFLLCVPPTPSQPSGTSGILKLITAQVNKEVKTRASG